MKQVALLSLAILAALLLIKGGASFSSSGEGLSLVEAGRDPVPVAAATGEVELPPEIDLKQAEALFDRSVERFREELDAAQHSYEKRVDKALQQARSKLLAQLQTRVDKKITRVSLLRQTVRMATDMLSSGPSRAEEWMKQNFENPLRPILEQLSARISKAQHQLTLDRNAALSAFETSFQTDIPLQLEASAQASQLVGGQVLGGLSQGAEGATAGLGLTAATTIVFMKSDMADLKKAPTALKKLNSKIAMRLSDILNARQLQKILGKRLTPIASRFAKKIAASGVLVVADGPLPIGDLLAVAATGISSAWTIYEVWNLGAGARADIMEGAEKNFAKVEAQIRAEVLEPARREHRKLRSSVEPLRASLIKELSEL